MSLIIDSIWLLEVTCPLTDPVQSLWKDTAPFVRYFFGCLLFLVKSKRENRVFLKKEGEEIVRYQPRSGVLFFKDLGLLDSMRVSFFFRLDQCNMSWYYPSYWCVLPLWDMRWNECWLPTAGLSNSSRNKIVVTCFFGCGFSNVLLKESSHTGISSYTAHKLTYI